MTRLRRVWLLYWSINYVYQQTFRVPPQVNRPDIYKGSHLIPGKKRCIGVEDPSHSLLQYFLNANARKGGKIERTGDGQHISHTSDPQESKPTLLYVPIHFSVSQFLPHESHWSLTPYFRCIFCSSHEERHFLTRLSATWWKGDVFWQQSETEKQNKIRCFIKILICQCCWQFSWWEGCMLHVTVCQEKRIRCRVSVVQFPKKSANFAKRSNVGP